MCGLPGHRGQQSVQWHAFLVTSWAAIAAAITQRVYEEGRKRNESTENLSTRIQSKDRYLLSPSLDKNTRVTAFGV